jgi:hypothetical protein
VETKGHSIGFYLIVELSVLSQTFIVENAFPAIDGHKTSLHVILYAFVQISTLTDDVLHDLCQHGIIDSEEMRPNGTNWCKGKLVTLIDLRVII